MLSLGNLFIHYKLQETCHTNVLLSNTQKVLISLTSFTEKQVKHCHGDLIHYTSGHLAPACWQPLMY